MDLFELFGDEQHPAYQKLSVANGDTRTVIRELLHKQITGRN